MSPMTPGEPAAYPDHAKEPITHIAADLPPAVQRLTWFRRDDITGIADFIAGQRQR
jgi:hypothetical protein